MSQYSEKIQSLFGRIKFSSKPKFLDLTQEMIFPEKLREIKTTCIEEDKPIYLYNYIKQRESENFIVFTNSISYAKKLYHLLMILKFKVVLLHSEQQQKQRLKKLDQFKANQKNILVCTDIASRGLDIPQVKNVIHYQVPFDIDTYIHRSGRTARIGQDGVAYVLIGPKDHHQYLKLCQQLNKQQGLESMTMNQAEKEKLRTFSLPCLSSL